MYLRNDRKSKCFEVWTFQVENRWAKIENIEIENPNDAKKFYVGEGRPCTKVEIAEPVKRFGFVSTRCLLFFTKNPKKEFVHPRS